MYDLDTEACFMSARDLAWLEHDAARHAEMRAVRWRDFSSAGLFLVTWCIAVAGTSLTWIVAAFLP